MSPIFLLYISLPIRYTRYTEAIEVKNLFEIAGINLLGIVINASEVERKGYYYYPYYSHYSHPAKKKRKRR